MPAKKIPLHDLVNLVVTNKATDPQLSELASAVFELWGGARGVAKRLDEEWSNAKPGSLIRAKILEMLMQTVRFVNTSNKLPPNYAELLTDEELADELNTAIVPLIDYVESETPDGQQESA